MNDESQVQQRPDEQISRAAEQAHAEIARTYEYAIAALRQRQANDRPGRHGRTSAWP